MAPIRVQALAAADALDLQEAFRGSPIRDVQGKLARHLRQQAEGTRVACVARLDGEALGYATLGWRSPYAPFAQAGIPEIQDLNVAPRARRRGLASALLDALEAQAAERSARVGIGVGLYADYGPAQRLYALRGYVPDGRGIYWSGLPSPAGSMVRLDDELVLHLIKELRPG